jgi:hypothetical protein
VRHAVFWRQFHLQRQFGEHQRNQQLKSAHPDEVFFALARFCDNLFTCCG